MPLALMIHGIARLESRRMPLRLPKNKAADSCMLPDFLDRSIESLKLSICGSAGDQRESSTMEIRHPPHLPARE